MSDYYVTLSGKVNYRLAGGPIDEFSEHLQLFAAIGHAATSWARFESHLDAILIHVNAYEHSAIIYNPEHPITFDRKIKLLKRWFNQHPALAEFTDPIRRITSRGKELSKVRNNFLHFILEDCDEKTLKANFHGLKWIGNDEFLAQRVSITIDGLREFSSIVNAGNAWLEDISRHLFTTAALLRLRTPAPRIQRLIHLFRRWRVRLGF